MDTTDCQGCCNGDLQNGDNTVHGDGIKPQPFCLQDSQVPNKSPITPETLNVPGGCHGNCCILTVFNNPDMSTRQKDPYKDVEAPDNVQNTRQNSHLSLATLPPELILLIFSYLDSRFTLQVLTCVCRLFHDLLSPESCWKTRFGKRWPQRDRKEDYDYISSWKRICVQHEDMDKFWNDPDSTLDFYELKDQHFATVDAVHIMKGGELCISGSRDRTVGVWSLNALTDPTEAGYSKRSFKQALDGHKGWVWCLSSDPTGAPRVCSGSWDSRIKLWDLEGQNIEMTTLNAHRAAVLCMAWEQEMLISGSYDKTISLWDLRGGNSVGRLKNHTKPVLCLSVDDRFIISGSEDQTLSVYDRRAAKVFKTIKLGSPVFSMCRSSTCDYNYLRAGGREGRLYLLDTTFDKFEEITPSMDLESKGKISGMCHYGGAVVACSTDKSIKVLEPSRVLSVIHSFDCHSGEVASVSSRGSVLASCYSELSIGIWRPKSMRPGSA